MFAYNTHNIFTYISIAPHVTLTGVGNYILALLSLYLPVTWRRGGNHQGFYLSAKRVVKVVVYVGHVHWEILLTYTVPQVDTTVWHTVTYTAL